MTASVDAPVAVSGVCVGVCEEMEGVVTSDGVATAPGAPVHPVADRQRSKTIKVRGRARIG